jgi:microcin C transport system substrate-binding protein
VRRAPGEVTRRDTLALGAGAATMLVMRPALGQSEGQFQADVERHGMSGFGDLKYPAEFKHFAYVNPNAPRGGQFSQLGSVRWYNQNFNTFNSLNGFIFKGDAALGLELTFATLMVRAFDESDAVYGLAARAVVISPDELTYRFLLRPEAKFHDGTRLDAHDAAFSLNLLKSKGHPIISQQMRDVTAAEAIDDLTLVVRFAKGRGRDLPLFVVTLPIFSRAYYGKREFDESTMDVPLGSGPYKVGRLETGRFIEYDRVKDWWGADLPATRGQNNFDVLRWEFYRDREIAFEGFTGKNYLFREEFTSRTWATRYDFPALKDGRVKREVIPDDTPSGGQGWFFNTRREKFKDPRVREALNYAFDFEWTNKNIMYGSYQRTHSLFQNSDMMAVGKPGPDELALLEPFRGQVPEEVFGEPFVPPVSDGSGQDRALLRKASAMLQQAGYGVRDGKRVTPTGERFTVEFLLDEPSFQPHHMALIKNLTLLGIDASVRVIDHAQYKLRNDTREFDMAIQRTSFLGLPGDSLRTYFTSQAAAIDGSYNLAGIADPVIDALVDKIIAAETRATLIAGCKTLDRVFRAGRYWIPHWNKASHWIAYWDMFGRPPKKPRYDRGIPTTWWYDSAKAAKLQRDL